MASRDEAVRTIAREIERYLWLHREASDSPAGIRSWWLSPGLRAEPLSLVLLALDRLLQLGVVAKTEIEGGGVVYSSAGPRRPHS